MGLLKTVWKVATAPLQGAVDIGKWAADQTGLTNNTSDRDRYNQQIQGQYNQFQQNMPNLANLYQQGAQNVLNSYKPFQPLDNTSLTKYYDQSKQNLNYNMNQQVSDASSQAGALAGARGLANPSGFVANSAQNVRSSFVPQFGALEGQKFNAMSDMERYNNAGMNASNQDYTELLAQLLSGGLGATGSDINNRMNILNALSGLSQNYDPYSTQDKILNLFGDGAKTLASIYGAPTAGA